MVTREKPCGAGLVSRISQSFTNFFSSFAGAKQESEPPEIVVNNNVPIEEEAEDPPQRPRQDLNISGFQNLNVNSTTES